MTNKQEITRQDRYTGEPTYILNGTRYRHGTRHSYAYGKCSCDLCRAANTQKNHKRNRDRLYGRYVHPFVDAAPVRDHLNALRAQGWGLPTIAKLTGIHRTTLNNLVFGRAPSQQLNREGYVKPAELRSVSRENAERLLALKYDPLKSMSRGKVDPASTIRRIQALAAFGYSLNKQAELLGINGPQYALILDQMKITRATYLKVRQLYERLELVPAVANSRTEQSGITRSIRRAKANGWLPPLAWDDIENGIVGPEAEEQTLDLAKLAQINDGHKMKLNRMELKELVIKLHRQGLSALEIDRRLGKKPSTTTKYLMRLRDNGEL